MARNSELPPPGRETLVLAAGARPLPEYELVAVLGRGGFGEVWKALGPGRVPVALKFIRLGDRAGTTELRSLEVMKNIRHPHLLGLFGAWERDGHLVLAMELGDRTLDDRLREAQEQGEPGIPRDELLEYLREAAKAIDHLNAIGVQHRDIKPQNLLLVGGGVKVADFGLARVLGQEATLQGRGMTPSYAAPECIRGEVAPQSDQYSLAATYCELRSGRLPFEAGSVAQLLAVHLTQPPDLTMLPEAEQPVVARALAKDPAERWPSCRAFVEALERSQEQAPPRPHDAAARRMCPGCGRRLRVPAAAVGKPVRCPHCSHAVPPAASSRAPEPPAGTRGPTTAIRRALLGGAAALAAVALLLAGHFLFRGATSAPPAGPATSAGTPAQAAAPAPVAPVQAKRFTNSLGMELALLPAGEVVLGSPPEDPDAQFGETPQMRLPIAEPFYLGVHEVTVGQFRRFVEDTDYVTQAEKAGGAWGFDTEGGSLFQKVAHYTWRNPGFAQTDDHPVVAVTWNEALLFCTWLSRREGRHYRLPIEAEWEYACRAGTTTRYFWGDAAECLQGRANIADASLDRVWPTYPRRRPFGKATWNDGNAFTAPVGTFPANAFGLHDMHGNVREWCATPVFRGGSFSNGPADQRSATRGERTPPVSPTDTPDFAIGFRVLLSLPATPPATASP